MEEAGGVVMVAAVKGVEEEEDENDMAESEPLFFDFECLGEPLVDNGDPPAFSLSTSSSSSSFGEKSEM